MTGKGMAKTGGNGSMKIGELGARTRTQVVTIRHYEKEGLLPPARRTAGNFRLYDDTHVERLHFIRRCRLLGLSLQEIGRLLLFSAGAEPTYEDRQAIGHLIEAASQRVEELQALERSLRELLKPYGE